MKDDAIHQLVKDANPVGPGASPPDSFPSRSDLLGMIQERTRNMQNTDTTTIPAIPPPPPPSGTSWLRPVLVGLGIVALAMLVVLVVAGGGSNEPDVVDQTTITADESATTTSQAPTTTSTSSSTTSTTVAPTTFTSTVFAVPLRADLDLGSGFRARVESDLGIEFSWRGGTDSIVFITTLNRTSITEWQEVLGNELWELSEPDTALVGGQEAGFIDATWNGPQSTTLIRSTGFSYEAEPGRPVRIHSLAVDGQDLTVFVEAPAERFDALVEDFNLFAASIDWLQAP